MLQDDIKEFWGFYLIRGSVVRLSVCARHEGASFIVVKGLKVRLDSSTCIAFFACVTCKGQK